MRETFLIMFINASGLILMTKGVDFVTAAYFAILIAGMSMYVYVNILELKKPKSATTDKGEKNNF